MKGQIASLTSTRAFAAIFVVIGHFGKNVFPFNYASQFFGNGNLAVSYFFVLSGFVLFIAHREQHIKYKEFIKKRVARIVPLYLFALLMFISLPLYGYYINKLALDPDFKKEFVFSALLIQSYIPHYALTLNIPGWSLSVEMFFYLLFPLFMLLQRKHLKLFLTITALSFIASQAIHLWYFPDKKILPETILDTIFYNPIIHLNQFLIGICGGLMYDKYREKFAMTALLPLAFFVLIIMLIAFRPTTISYHTGLIAPIFAVFITSTAAANSKMLNRKWLVYLGEISYGIYILQFPVYAIFSRLNNQYFHIGEGYFFYSFLIILILVSGFCYHAIEKPLRNKINSLKFA